MAKALHLPLVEANALQVSVAVSEATPYSGQYAYEGGSVDTPLWFSGQLGTDQGAYDFVAGSDFVLTAVELQFQRTGDLAGKSLTAQIYSSAGNPALPSGLLGTSTNTVPANSFATDAMMWSAKFCFAGVPLTTAVLGYLFVHGPATTVVQSSLTFAPASPLFFSEK